MMELTAHGEVYGVRTGTQATSGIGTVAIKVGNKVLRFSVANAHLWTPGMQVNVLVEPVEVAPLVITQGSIDD